MPHILRGTRPRVGLWRWLANTVDTHYEVPESIVPVVDATKDYPIVFRYGQVSFAQGLAGPADMTGTFGPPRGKSWFISHLSFLVNPIRAGSFINIHLKPGTQAGFGAGQRVALARIPLTNITANLDYPLLQVATANAGWTTGGSGRPFDLYLAGAPPGSPEFQINELLEVTVSAALMNDVMEVRYRFVEQDLDVPPFG